MKYITFLNITAKLIFTVSIFIFIHKASDYIYVPLINSLGFIVAGVLALWIVFKNFGLRFKLPNLSDIKYQLKEGWYIFISTVSYNLYTNSPTFFIGILMDNKYVAFFSIAEKVVNILRQIINIILQVFYPYLAKMSKENFKIYAKTWFMLFKTLTILSILLCVFIIFMPKNIFSLIFSETFLPSLSMLKILILSLPLQSFMNLFGMQSMLLLGFNKAYGLSYVIFSTLFLVMLPIILWLSKNVFLSIGLILFTEFMIVVYRVLYLYKKEILHALFGYPTHSGR